MKGSSVAIVGAGISGLALAASLTKHSSLRVTLYEREKRFGGRIFTSQVSPNVFADLGANIIDFENKNQEKKVKEFLTPINKSVHSKLQLFRQPFLIYEQGQLRKGDYQKQRYYYQNGFKQLIDDIRGFLASFEKQCQLIDDTQIVRIERKQSKWVIYDSKEKPSNEFDFLVLSCSGPGIVQLLKASHSEQLNNLLKQVTNVQYTKQISLAFEVATAEYSSVLFRNHPITFLSSHIEKYPQQPPLIVMQTNEAFSEKYFDQSEEVVEESIRKVIPSFLEKNIGRCVKIYRWNPSLIRHKRGWMGDKIGQNVFIVGDVVAGSSRVANAIQSSLKVSSYFDKMLGAKL